MRTLITTLTCLILWLAVHACGTAQQASFANKPPVRVFIFAGQSNMVGTHSRVSDIAKFPPFAGLDKLQSKVLFSYNLGRETKQTSNGWTSMQPTGDYFGPELSFARRVSQNIEAPIAIIKVASGGTSLGEDWNPDNPGGFKLYPLALEHVRKALDDLTQQKTPYRLEGFMWHQGENDMFDKSFKPAYRANLENFIQRWRRDLHAPELKFYVGELCTNTIWGMDNRDNMLAIRTAQKAVASQVAGVTYVPTSHDAVEIGGDVGLHYHYGTLGQLEHGENYAQAYLKTLADKPHASRTLKTWPYPKNNAIKLFVLAGHRNMEGERAFRQNLKSLKGYENLIDANPGIPFKYSTGGGFTKSDGWEALRPAGAYETFGPELSFVRALTAKEPSPIAIAKFTHCGTQINDWTPEGTTAKDMHQYPAFIDFIKTSMQELTDRGHRVELAGIFYHVGENDMAFYPYKKKAAEWLKSSIVQSRIDLEQPNLKWFVSRQTPPNEKGLDSIDIAADFAKLDESDPYMFQIDASDLQPHLEKLVLDTEGIVLLGEKHAKVYIDAQK